MGGAMTVLLGVGCGHDHGCNCGVLVLLWVSSNEAPDAQDLVRASTRSKRKKGEGVAVLVGVTVFSAPRVGPCLTSRSPRGTCPCVLGGTKGCAQQLWAEELGAMCMVQYASCRRRQYRWNAACVRKGCARSSKRPSAPRLYNSQKPSGEVPGVRRMHCEF